MATFIVRDGGLTFEQAIKRAEARQGADTIQFKGDGLNVVRLEKALTLKSEIVIDGDINGDGVSDVVFVAADESRHFNIAVTANVTLKNVDLYGGFDNPKTYDGSERLPAASGANGSAGTTVQSGYILDGADGRNDAGNGSRGKDGVDGVDAAGSILNEGHLKLIRVGFGNNSASGERGQDGGEGGAGGSSRAGHGLQDHYGTLNDPFGGFGPLYDLMKANLMVGGEGGDGGAGGDGARGGNGGDGGDAAAAILNNGSLELVDTVFAGRLTTGVVGSLSTAIGGFAGSGGSGGAGGDSYGGDGGVSGLQTELADRVWYGYTWDTTADGDIVNLRQTEDGRAGMVVIIVHDNKVAPAGQGGDGGIGGDGARGGSGGNSGNAATVLNNGTLAGSAVFIEGANLADTYEGGRGGFGGLAGRSVAGRGGEEYLGFDSVSFDQDLNLRTYRQNGQEPPDHILQIWSMFAASTGITFDTLVPAGVSAYPTNGTANDGSEAGDGAAGAKGFQGLAGTASSGIGGDGSTSVQTDEALVYVHGMGQQDGTGDLSFNIIRVGDIRSRLTVEWRLVGEGPNGVTAADFAEGSMLSGRVTFKALVFAEDTPRSMDYANNVRTISFAVAADTLAELLEGYRFELAAISGGGMLGTRVITGTIDDGSRDGEAILGNNRGNQLGGTNANDEISGNGGGDKLIGKNGDDLLVGGKGNDQLLGGKGNDRLVGSEGDDTLTGGGGVDIFQFGMESGRDTVIDLTANDVVLLDDELWGGGLGRKQVVNSFGEDLGSDYMLDFGTVEIIFKGVATASSLINAMEIF